MMVTLTFVSLISRDTLLCHKKPLFFKHFFFKNYLSSRQFTKHVFNCHYEFNLFPPTPYIADWREGFPIVYTDNSILDNSEARSPHLLTESVVDDLYICFQ